MRLAYTTLYVPDVPATLAFYERAFGLTRRFLHEGNDWAELETGSTSLSFAAESLTAGLIDYTKNRPDAKPAGAEVAFVTDNVPSAFARAVEAGAIAVSAPAQKPWGQVVSYVRDCNGFLVEICSAVG
jgi:lactoylglutathione lyase